VSLSAEQIRAAAEGYGLAGLSLAACERLAEYIALVLHWNQRLSLTGARTEVDLLSRHVLEGVYVAERLPAAPGRVMDFGSGMGIPGIPLAICRPDLDLVLAEARGKRASFLREVKRSLDLSCEIYHGRVEQMPSDLHFSAITMRAVERIGSAVRTSARRLGPGGLVYVLTTLRVADEIIAADSGEFMDWRPMQLPKSSRSVLLVGERTG
jgi:16S rRNA (guanine527-N7)-methyltransferase